ncbi:hypothetical protein [uncultured Castellaniella sp.]|uniref:hypothetical protein n=1 Tax=uncultured Castellaniella sp. TaxID=647907 RepID=UPI00262BCE5C|nr:hypothetical protein [uncultured Castellaniella sp.]
MDNVSSEIYRIILLVRINIIAIFEFRIYLGDVSFRPCPGLAGYAIALMQLDGGISSAMRQFGKIYKGFSMPVSGWDQPNVPWTWLWVFDSFNVLVWWILN